LYLQPLSKHHTLSLPVVIGDKYNVVHVRFRATSAVVNAASNPPPLQFVPENSKLPRMLQQPVDCHNRRPLWCLFGVCFTLIHCFLFAPSFTTVEISSSVLESTAACASPIKNLEIGHQAGLSGDDNNNRNYNA
jgi:hypothetical protein